MSQPAVHAIALVGAFALAAPALAQTAPAPAQTDWSRALAEDARAFHAVILDSHPGPVDPENPGFRKLMDDGLALALKRAATAKTYPDYYFALVEYAASFDDGHLGLTNYRNSGWTWTSRWPGFLTALRDGETRVVFSEEPSGPPLGARLVGCDGRAPEALAREMAGRTAGRWNLATRREAYSATVFVDQMNPYVRRPDRCEFEVDGARRQYRLSWRPLPDATRDKGFAAARAPRYATGIELRSWAGPGHWISLGDFDGDPNSEAGRRLTALQAEIEAKAETLRAAPAIVFDLRGNNGGSSAWLHGMAQSLWGKAWVDAKQPRSKGVDWRPSAGNIAHFKEFRAVYGKGEKPDPEILDWLDKAIAGMEGARAAGEPLWRQRSDDEAGDDRTGPALPADGTPMRARTFVLTDTACASACLDAVDLLTALGAVHVGQETSADTLYMEIREQPLPGDRVTAYVPIKVYRGRARGSNVPATPTHAYKGSLGDNAAVEAWLAGLARG